MGYQRRTGVSILAGAALLLVACSGSSTGSGDAAGVVARPASPTTTTTAPAAPAVAQTSTTTFTVSRIIDGDTLTLSDGRRVRLAQVDAPETNECFGSESTAALSDLAPAGATVTLRRPSTAPATDRYGRTLAEVFVDEASVDEALIRDGAAEWYEQFAHEDDDLARRLEAAEQDARANGRGLWAECRATPASAPAAAPPPAPANACDVSYPDVCIPPAPPDLDCGEVSHRDFTVRPPDPHGFDRDRDGVGCET